MRKLASVCCIVVLCSVILGPTSLAAGPDRGDSLRSRGSADDTLMLWRAHARLHRDIARLLGVLPFAPPPVAPDGGDDPIRGGQGLSDDPDPTGSRGEDDDEQGGGGGPDGDQESPRDEENTITQLGQR